MLIFAPLVLGFAGIVLFSLLLYLLSSRTKRSRRVAVGWNQEWFEDFSAFRYLPMRRLLSGTKEAFAQQKQQGSKVSLRRFRAERRVLFCQYLQDLRRDFRALSMGAKLAMLHAHEDQSEHLTQLVRLEWRFRWALCCAYLQVAKHAIGWDPGDSTSLIDTLQHFEFSLREARLAHSNG